MECFDIELFLLNKDFNLMCSDYSDDYEIFHNHSYKCRVLYNLDKIQFEGLRSSKVTFETNIPVTEKDAEKIFENLNKIFN